MMSVRCAVRDHLQFQARDLRQNWFPERQVILRQEESVRAIQLSSNSQLLAACILVVGGVWTTTATTVCVRNLLHSTTSEVTPEWSQHRAADMPMSRGIVNLQDHALTFEAPQSLVFDMRMSSEQPEGHRRTNAMTDFRTSANDPVAKQERELPAARGRAEELERALTAAQQQLEDVQVQRQSVLQERDSLAARLADTEKRMRAANADHAEAVGRLTQETRKSIIEVERIFNAISVDPARLVPRGNTAGRGGPFVSWSDRASAQSAAPLSAADAVAPNVARLDALTQLLRTMPLAAPLEDFAITSPFGRRTDPFSGQRAMHEGIDFRAPRHTPVTATAPGRVVFAGRHGAHGLMVEIEHGHDIHTRYAHLDRITVALGQKVELHQKIGLLGTTGRASGPHVHYEIRVAGRPRDPLNFLKAASHAHNAAQQH